MGISTVETPGPPVLRALIRYMASVMCKVDHQGADFWFAIRGPVVFGSLVVSGALLTACAQTTHVLVGAARPPIAPDQVRIYSQPPATPFVEIATLDASSKSAFGNGGQKSVDKVIERLKIEAAKLGANGVILEGFSDAETGSIGTGVGSDSYGNHSAVGVGVGGSLGIYKKTGHGDAIYVPPAGT